MPSQPPMHRLARDPEPPARPPPPKLHRGSPREPPDTSAPRHPAPPACSGVCRGSGGASVTYQAKPCHPSGAADMSRNRRNQTLRRWGGQASNLRPTDYEEEAPSRLRNEESELGDFVARGHPALNRICRDRTGEHHDIDRRQRSRTVLPERKGDAIALPRHPGRT
jgi:hypothetical protein